MRPSPSGITAVGVCALWAAALLCPIAPALAQGQLPQDKAARMLLDSARRAYNEGKYDYAAQRFGEYLRRYSGGRDARAADYGLALCLLEAPKRDHKAIGDALRRVVESASGTPMELATARYYYAVSVRAFGEQASAQAAAQTDPKQAAKLRQQAQSYYTEADRQFAAAGDAFLAAAGPARPPSATAPAEPPEELRWAARARCDRAEMLLRLRRFDEAIQAAEKLLAHPVMDTTRCRDAALYHLGYARFAKGEPLEAGRALSRLAPFGQPFGIHARFLLARVHHLAGERPKAAAQYEAVLADHEARKKRAAEALRRPQGLTPRQKAETEALARAAAPDYVVRARFHLAQLQAEMGRFAEALSSFEALLKQHAAGAMADEAKLRVGYCHMKLRGFPQAIQALQALTNHPRVGDKAMWWLARAQVGAADPKNAPAYQAALSGAIQTLRQAADRAGQLARTDPAAKLRRADILMELADTQQLAGQHKEAADTCRRVVDERGSAEHVEEALQRQAAALHLAGQYRQSDDVCRRFEQSYPRSTLLPAVWFRSAENAYFQALAAAKNPTYKDRRRDVERLFDEAVRRYRRLMKQAGDFRYANLARHGLATLHYRRGEYDRAAALLAKIPQFERSGDLASVPHLLADCLLRTLPPESEDALGTARLVARLDQATKLLEGFVGANAKSPEAPAALLKLGHCYRRIGEMLSDRAERQRVLMQARAAYERIQREFAASPLVPTAHLERAKCMALLGDVGGAGNELNRFQSDPLRGARIAPLAIAHLGGLLRRQNRAADAVKLLSAYRTQHEAALLADADRRAWAGLLQYEHALALRATGKVAEAAKLFDAMAAQFPGRAEAVNAVWRGAQCRREEFQAQRKADLAAAGKPGAKPEEIAAARRRIREALVALRQVAARVHAEAMNQGRTAPGSKVHLHLLYEAAWCYRVLADGEVDSARQKAQAEALEKALAAMAKTTPPGQAPPTPRAPDVPLSAVGVQPSEALAHRQYERLIAAAPDSSLAARARLELAEMHGRRPDRPESVDAAVRLLTEAIEKDPPPELAETIRLRLASSLLAKKQPAAARAHLEAIGPKPRGYYTATQARYLAGEAMIQQKDWAAAVKHLQPFRNPRDPIRTVQHINDRALLRLGQACLELKQWDAARQAFQQIVQRHGTSAWLEEAYYGIGRAWQEQKRYDDAVKAYGEVTRRTVAEAAARAQFQIGACRMAQQRYEEAAEALLVVPLTYGYPEWSAAARCEAARAHRALKKTVEAARLYRQVLREHPTSRWARVAREQLARME